MLPQPCALGDKLLGDAVDDSGRCLSDVKINLSEGDRPVYVSEAALVPVRKREVGEHRAV